MSKILVCPECNSEELELRGERRTYHGITGYDEEGGPQTSGWNEGDVTFDYSGEFLVVYCLDCDHEWAHDPKNPSIREHEEPVARCDNCCETFPESSLVNPIPGLYERMDPDGPEPAGECPECGALAYTREGESGVNDL